ncbi:hypothetical protein GCM10028805_54540 [Spirosoma harenae]
MTNLSIFACSLLCLPSLLLAQGNYVVNSPNNTSTAVYGTFNTLVGPGAGASGHITGNRNTVTGYNAGISLSSGTNNSFYGVDAGEYTTSGNNNTFLGRAAGLSNTTGSNNVFTGYQTGYANTGGSGNVFTGYLTGYTNATGYENVFTGHMAGYKNTSGDNSVFTGHMAGYSNTSGHYNTFSGAYAGYANTTATNNVFTGYFAGYRNTTGFLNTFTGAYAGNANITGSRNTFSGSSAGNANTTGSNNTFVGNIAGLNNTTGNNNTIIGPASGTAITSSDNNVLIGYNSQADDGLTNAIAIGANSRVAISNALILGYQVNVGIGTTTPSTKLHITTGTANTSGLRLQDLTSSSPASQLNVTKFLTVDGTGNVILGSTTSSLRVGADSWSVSGDQLQNTNSGSVVIGKSLSVPAGYKLVVEQGILTERVKVAVKNTSEWSDYVFKPGYSLKPLSEVEQYIAKHEHLPGIPSATEMVKQGNDLHQTDAKLLAKIEELTLYSIQQDKKIAVLQGTKQQDQQKIQALEQKQAELERLLYQLLKQK